MARKTTADLVAAVAGELKITKAEAKLAVAAFTKAVVELTKDSEALQIKDLGTFRISQVKERPGINPKTGAALVVPARKAVNFKAAPGFKAAVQ